ncbi:uncharacterized protein GGS25DRAFT_507913 [Hypoxylon fragiforme]|uniref:uncharacterized protein n=1 Tax=Hypoxylon fragiforme TaxID=63214 RepID=UPI0020C628F1|nr:uncharacterized protein GGS25DRAFT_507913 [Hypoxylon fragiforme]KAI2604362.1 hypothetical protein GGS25DRAFT_507913 [Hypoxylon fragiforme]
MCLYQNVHAAYHHELLNFNADERDRHVCEVEANGRSSSTLLSPEGDALGAVGIACPLHSCCRVLSREIVFRCGDAPEDEGGLCENAFVEIVFVALAMTGRGDRGGEEGIRDGEEVEEAIDALAVTPTMEFWPEDQPGKRMVVFLEDEDEDEVVEKRGSEGEEEGDEKGGEKRDEVWKENKDRLWDLWNKLSSGFRCKRRG